MTAVPLHAVYSFHNSKLFPAVVFQCLLFIFIDSLQLGQNEHVSLKILFFVGKTDLHLENVFAKVVSIEIVPEIVVSSNIP